MKKSRLLGVLILSGVVSLVYLVTWFSVMPLIHAGLVTDVYSAIVIGAALSIPLFPIIEGPITLSVILILGD